LAAARLLADCWSLGTPERGLAAIAALRDDPEGEVYGWIEGGEVIAVYGLRAGKLHFVLPWLAVHQDWRGQRYGRSALVDALRRCGRKPLIVESDDAGKGWFESIGFRVVGRSPVPGEGFRYRLGWYAPRRPGEPGHGAHQP
jgi:ribosomal protein S18 acetylase RimI-like enzyme